MIESLSNHDILRIAKETSVGGEYEEARQLLDKEMARRCLNLCDDPTGFVDALDEA